jgi:hypothetical protein
MPLLEMQEMKVIGLTLLISMMTGTMLGMTWRAVMIHLIGHDKSG